MRVKHVPAGLMLSLTVVSVGALPAHAQSRRVWKRKPRRRVAQPYRGGCR
jgi:hypothetical protein